MIAPTQYQSHISNQEKSHFVRLENGALNHNKSHTLYVLGTEYFIDDEATKAKLPSNVVSVEINGPGRGLLSSYNLPNTLPNAGREEGHRKPSDKAYQTSSSIDHLC